MLHVAVLGSSGMLGSALTSFLRSEGIDVTEFNRTGKSSEFGNKVNRISIDENLSIREISNLNDFDVVVNAIGVIRQVIDEDSNQAAIMAHTVNSFFPSLLDEFARSSSIPVIQIGTDCVFSGKTGKYAEDNKFEYTDLYSFTKIVGEELSPNTKTLRTSIVGRELKSNHSLLNWVLSQPRDAKINGYVNHNWNGLTTLHYAKIVSGVIKNKNFGSGIQHIVPADIVSKFELIRKIAQAFSRQDLEIMEFEAEERIDRSLTTIRESQNQKLWSDAGYLEIPTIGKMISEYADWVRNSLNTFGI
jgi:dTDP-4-dehydrorhamnose reductase